MANVVEVIVQGTDRTNPAFNRALNNTKQLGREMKGFGSVMNQAGNIAAAFGSSQLAIAINSMESAIHSTSTLTKELGKSKLGFAAVASAAVFAGISTGNFLRQFVPFFNEPDKLERSLEILQQIGQVSAQRLTIRDPQAGALAAQAAETAAQIRKINRTGLAGQKLALTKEEQELVFQLEQLQAERSIKLEEEKERTVGDMIRRSKAEILGMEVEHLGLMAAEDIRYAETKRALEVNQMLEAEGRNTLLEDAYRIHQLKLAQIHMAGQDKILAQEKQRRQQMLASQEHYAEGTASIFGNLANVAAAFGKKGFAAFKAFRIAEALASTYAGAARALADWPWPYSIAVAAAVVAAGIANVATIASAQPAGQAHSGLDYVPADSTWMLQQGERVVQRDQNERLTDFLEGTGDSSKPTQVNIYLDGVMLGRGLGQMSKDGRLEISARAIV